jgi:hypothetical protein
MSVETIDIMNEHRKNQIELSPSSEEFQIVGGSTFRGIFDRAHVENNKDGGNILQKNLTPVIMVPVKPAGLSENVSKIRRENYQVGDKEFTFKFIGLDEEGIPLIWLY